PPNSRPPVPSVSRAHSLRRLRSTHPPRTASGRYRFVPLGVRPARTGAKCRRGRDRSATQKGMDLHTFEARLHAYRRARSEQADQAVIENAWSDLLSAAMSL